MFDALVGRTGILFRQSSSKAAHKNATIESLPPEIQLLVAQHLTRRDKLTMLCTSRHFHKLLQPQIYQDLGATRNIARLVDTLVRKPLLCACPRSLRLLAWDSPYPGAVNESRNLDLDLLLICEIAPDAARRAYNRVIDISTCSLCPRRQISEPR
ncbi:hypothetical protein BJX70DRAFT_352439 [Aspergillus crustosus]